MKVEPHPWAYYVNTMYESGAAPLGVLSSLRAIDPPSQENRPVSDILGPDMVRKIAPLLDHVYLPAGNVLWQNSQRRKVLTDV